MANQHLCNNLIVTFIIFLLVKMERIGIGSDLAKTVIFFQQVITAPTVSMRSNNGRERPQGQWSSNNFLQVVLSVHIPS